MSAIYTIYFIIPASLFKGGFQNVKHLFSRALLLPPERWFIMKKSAMEDLYHEHTVCGNNEKLRTERGLSQIGLGKQMSVNNSTVTRWENGTRLPDAAMIARLSKVLDVDVSTLLSAAVGSDESTNVILVDDSRVILADGLAVLEKVAIVVSGFVISVLGLLLTVFLRRTNRESHSFLIFFLLLVGYTGSAMICQLAGTTLLSKITLFTNSLFSSLLIPAITLYLLRCAGKSWRHSPLFVLVIALWAVYFVLLVITQFTTCIYYYTPDNVYHRGPWYPLLLIPPVLLMAANMIGLYHLRSSLTHRQQTAFLIYFVVPLICMLIQMMFFGLFLIVFGTSLAILFMFIFLLMDQIEQNLMHQREIVDQEWSTRKSNHLKKLMKSAGFSVPSACMENIQYVPERNLNKEQLAALATNNYVRDKHNILLLGPTGGGKTYIGCALGVAAVREFFRVKYIRSSLQIGC